MTESTITNYNTEKKSLELPLHSDGQYREKKSIRGTVQIIRNGYASTVSHYFNGRANQVHTSLDSLVVSFAEKIKRMMKDITSSPKDYLEFVINDFSVIVTNETPISINGLKGTKREIFYNLSRFLYRVNNDMSRSETMMLFYRICNTPYEISHVLENRVPFYFFNNGRRVDVRLNAKQISDDKIALEISDSVWGTISFKDLSKYLGHYLHGHNRGSWKFLSPQKLYFLLMGKEITESDSDVMIAFLEQNRTSKLIEDRAEILLEQTLAKYKNKVKMLSDKETREQYLLVKGIDNDWLFSWNTNRKSAGRQLVTTAYLSIIKEDDTIGEWRAVCVDNLQSNSPIHDQLVTRLLVCINDRMTKQRVSTMKSIPSATHRINFELVDENSKLEIAFGNHIERYLEPVESENLA
tara:strand:- start:9830 stop:11059 length:1230 start_codon:yes stop_codon:yes gene_type:complete